MEDSELTGAQAPAGESESARPGAPGRQTAAAALAERLRASCASAVVGLEREIELCLAALLAGGHVLLEGPPGVAKTLLVRTLCAALGLDYGRVQFTPDLMPADIVGTGVFLSEHGTFEFRAGPVFVQGLLADEINRAPAKTQAALLEAMQEGSVTVDGERHELPEPFCVFATQNPIEHEGTYPLPEAQLDRFLFKVILGYPNGEQEAQLLREAHGRPPRATPKELGVERISSAQECLEAAAELHAVAVQDDLADYAVALLGATRSHPSLVLGASPRAGVMLLRAAKALALLQGRDYVLPDDIKSAFRPCMRHRVQLDPAEEIEGVLVDDVLDRILDSVEVPR